MLSEVPKLANQAGTRSAGAAIDAELQRLEAEAKLRLDRVDEILERGGEAARKVGRAAFGPRGIIVSPIGERGSRQFRLIADATVAGPSTWTSRSSLRQHP